MFRGAKAQPGPTKEEFEASHARWKDGIEGLEHSNPRPLPCQPTTHTKEKDLDRQSSTGGVHGPSLLASALAKQRRACYAMPFG